VPAAVARYLRGEAHEAWTAYEAHLEEASDAELIAYAADHDAIAVTTNRDFVTLARRLRAARVVHLRVSEADAVLAMDRALRWLESSGLPDGMALRVPKRSEIRVLPPLVW
jgi:predicted nuclease of predicted toxin-antitoxin system